MSTDRREAVERRSERSDHCYFCDQNITSEEEESPSLSINLSFFEEPKSSEVAVGLNLSSGPRVKYIDRLHNVAQNCWKAAVIKHPACQDFLKEAVRSTISLVSYAAVFRLVTQRSGEERCVA